MLFLGIGAAWMTVSFAVSLVVGPALRVLGRSSLTG